jgi:hypothetical protein
MIDIVRQFGRLVLDKSGTSRRSRTNAVIRIIDHADIDRLLLLERHVWTAEQAASAGDMARRIERHPEFCIAAFCPDTGQALASLFARPTCRVALSRAENWVECASGDVPDGRYDALFGISLSSRDPQAAKGIFEYIWPVLLKNGVKTAYLGSPIPGLRRWLEENPDGKVADYVHAKQRGMPLDRQLRYYATRGFTEIIDIKPDYFPHEESLDYGVMIAAKVPLSDLTFATRWVPLGVLKSLSKSLFKLL